MSLIKPQDVKIQMDQDLIYGLERGTTTYIKELDEAWTWRNGEVNIHSGYSNEGKGTFIRFISLIKALEEKKKFIFYAPEDGPAQWFFNELIHTLSGKSTDKDNYNFIGVDLYNYCFDLIRNLFIFHKRKSPENTIENLIKDWENHIKKEDIYGFIIDPYVRLTRSNQAPERDDLYAGYLMGMLTDFTGDYYNCSVHMVMHQQTPKRTLEGYYPPPNMYAVKGGGTFADTADNILSAWRPFYAKDKLNTEVHITSEKIKKQKLVGIPQTLKFSFDRKTNRYCHYGTTESLYNFSKFLI